MKKTMINQSKIVPKGLDRIKARRTEVIQTAKELRETIGDPVDALSRTLAQIPVDSDVWDVIVEEP